MIKFKVQKFYGGFVHYKYILLLAVLISGPIASAGNPAHSSTFENPDGLADGTLTSNFLVNRITEESEIRNVQQFTVSGTVVDGSGIPLPGANVLEKGTINGTQTDFDGNFTLSISDENATLVVSYIGFITTEIPVQGQGTVSITLREDSAALEEVVVIGYGAVTRKEVTGAISSIDSEDLQKVAASSFTSAIQGKVPGVNITQTSGAPGAASSVRIRGVGTTGEGEPLYVVDGIPMSGGSMNIPGGSGSLDPLSILNPNDIESIEILKDAASAAIYGARAANGVILVTTKRGREGLTRVNVEAYTGFQQVWKKPDLLNAEEFATLANELYVNSGMAPNPEWADPSSLGEGTYMPDHIFRNGLIQNYDLRVSGGSEKLTGSISLGYREQEGTMIETTYERFTGRLTGDYRVNDRLRFGSSLAFALSEAKGVQNDHHMLGILALAKQFYPTLEPTEVIGGSSAYYNSSGDNPLLLARSIDNRLNDSRMFGNLFAEFEIIQDLVWKTSIGIDANNGRTRRWEPKVQRGYYTNLSAQLDERYSQRFNWILENTLSFSKAIDNHNISVVVGQTAQENETNWISVTARDFQNELLQVINGSLETERKAYGSGNVYRLASYLGRINYSFKEKYLLSASIRRDGSSNFGPRYKWGNFPSVSAGWNIAEESFMEDLSFLNSLKIRGSWGQLGNDKIGAFGYMSTIRLGTVSDNYVLGPDQNIIIGASMARPGNPELKWETSEQTDIGIDISLFNGKVYSTADYYIKDTKDMLINLPVSLEAGFQAAPSANGGIVQNRGFELLLGYRDSYGDFDFDVSGNLSKVKNEVVSLGGGQPIVGPRVSQITSPIFTEVGQPIGYYRGYIVDGIYQTDDEVNTQLQPSAVAGDFIWRDVNGDGEITTEDQVKIGTPWPSLTYGMNFDAAYKGFDFNLLLQGVAGNEILNATKRSTYPIKYQNGAGVINGVRGALNRWVPGSGRNEVPRLTYNDANLNYSSSSTFYIEEGDYLRVRNVTLGYTLQQNMVTKIGLQNARLYVSSQNLFTFTNYSGLDPEVDTSNPLLAGVDSGIYPQPRTVLAGLSISF